MVPVNDVSIDDRHIEAPNEYVKGSGDRDCRQQYGYQVLHMWFRQITTRQRNHT
jgi:hypothetical protein